MKSGFKRIEHGYREKPDYVGYGYLIYSNNDFDSAISYKVYDIETVKIDSDNFIDLKNSKVIESFDYLKDAKDYCELNAKHSLDENN